MEHLGRTWRENQDAPLTLDLLSKEKVMSSNYCSSEPANRKRMPLIWRKKPLVSAVALALMASSHASFAYNAKICFLDLDNQKVSGLSVSAGGKSATLDTDSCYLINGLVEGDHSLTMSGAGYKTFPPQSFSVGSNHSTHHFGNRYAVKSANGYRIVGRVIDASRQPLSGVQISAGSTQATSGSDGKFELYFSQPNTYTLNFSKGGYLPISKATSVSDSRPSSSVYDVMVITGYTVRGTVLDIDKKGVSGVTVSVGGKTATTDVNGSYTVTGITNYGSYTLTLSKSGKTLQRSLSIPQSSPIYTMYTLYMVDDYLVYGGVYDVYSKPIAGVRVEAGGQFATTDSNGLYQLPVSTAGSHRVTIKDSRYKEVATSGYVTDTSPSGRAGNLFAISLVDGYRIEGKVNLADSSVPLSMVTVEADDKSVHPDSEGNFSIKGLTEAKTYTLKINVAKEGYKEIAYGFSINDSQPYRLLGQFNFVPNLNMALDTDSAKIQQGGSVEYTVNIANRGYGPATKVKMWSQPELPAGITFISAKPVEPLLANYNVPAGGGITNNCNITDDTRILECKYLGTLGGGQTTQMKVVVGFGITSGSTSWGIGGGGGYTGSGGSSSWSMSQPFSLSFAASGKGCGTCSEHEGGGDIVAPPALKYMAVEPYLSLNVSGGASQVKVGQDLIYNVVVRNSEKSPSAVTNTKLKVELPQIVSVVSATTSEGICSTAGSTITCDLDTLPNDSSSQIALTLKSSLVGQGYLKYTLSSEQAPAVEKSSNTFTVIPEPPPPPPMPVGDADLMFVIDDTGSMSEELLGLRRAVENFITTYGSTGPNVGLITFKDNVTNRIKGSDGSLAATNNMNWLLNGYSTYITGIKQLRADLGADCPEASLKALDAAKDNVKIGGRMVLITDASSHPDVDVDALITALRAKGVRVDVILSGEECVGMCGIDTGEANKDSVSAIEIFSRIASETDGLFVTPFEVNDGSASGSTYYEKTVLNLLLSNVKPTVTGVTPRAIPQNSTVDVVLTGVNTNFGKNTDVSFGDNLTVNDIEVVSPTELKVNVTAKDSTPVAFYNAKVTTTRSEESTEEAQGMGVLEVVEASETPQILSIQPASVNRDGEVSVTINTANVSTSGATLSFDSDSGITVKSVKANGQNSLIALLDVSQAQLGAHKATIKASGNEVTEACSMTASPTEGALLITPSLDEGNVPRLTAVEPEQGAQGAVRRIHIQAVNTHFQQDITELRIGDQNDVYVLELTILNETEAQALIQIDGEAELGFRDVFMYTDQEFASLLNGFEVAEKCGYALEGYVLGLKGDPIEDVEIDTGAHLAFSNNTGFFRAEGLCEGEYVADIVKEGYTFDPTPFVVSDNTAINGVVKLPIEAPSSALVVQSKPDTWQVYQGETIGYTLTATNYGKVAATGVVLTEKLPADTEIVSVDMLDGGECQTSEDNVLTCTLPDLDPNKQAAVKLTLRANGNVRLVNETELESTEYPVSSDKSWTSVNPYLSVAIEDNLDPVAVGSTLSYTVKAELSEYAAEAEGVPTTATNVVLVSYLPEGVTVEEAYSDHATCEIDSSQDMPSVTCQVEDLSIDNPEDVSQVTVDMRVTVNDAGLLALIHEARVSSDEFSIHKDRERTKVLVGDDVVDAAIVIDITGSMQEEINATTKAIQKYIKDNVDANSTIALVTFKDEVTVSAVTTNLSLLEETLAALEAEGGGTCPEASVEAIDAVIPHVKEGGIIIFASDASPYDDADIQALAEKLVKKKIKLVSVITGDCSDGEKSWNDVAAEQGTN